MSSSRSTAPGTATDPATAATTSAPALTPVHYHDGPTALSGWLALPDRAGPAPAVVVAHEAPGINDHIKARARALASCGYVALAMDMYGEPYSLDEAIARHERVMSTPGLILRRAAAALAVLTRLAQTDTARLGAVGFCQGGVAALELARAGLVECAVGIHPGLARPAGSHEGRMRARVLMLIGDDDPVVREDDRASFAREMRERGAAWEMHLFGGVGHTFSNPDVDALQRPGFRYDARADRTAWDLTLRFLRDALGA